MYQFLAAISRPWQTLSRPLTLPNAHPRAIGDFVLEKVTAKSAVTMRVISSVRRRDIGRCGEGEFHSVADIGSAQRDCALSTADPQQRQYQRMAFNEA